MTKKWRYSGTRKLDNKKGMPRTRLKSVQWPATCTYCAQDNCRVKHVTRENTDQLLTLIRSWLQLKSDFMQKSQSRRPPQSTDHPTSTGDLPPPGMSLSTAAETERDLSHMWIWTASLPPHHNKMVFHDPFRVMRSPCKFYVRLPNALHTSREHLFSLQLQKNTNSDSADLAEDDLHPDSAT